MPANNTIPEVSVILPCYNCAKTVENTLNSILRQTFAGYEIIVINDGSTDNTKEVLEAYFKNKNVNFTLINQENQTQSVARNNGIKTAKGKYLAFIDADDVWHDNKLELSLAELKKHPNASLVYTNLVLVNEKGEITGKERKPLPDGKNAYVALLFKGNHITPSTIVMKTRAAKEANGFDETKDSVGLEDYEFVLRLSKNHTFIHLDKYLINYLVSPQSWSRTKTVIHHNNLIKLLKKHFNGLPKRGLLQKIRFNITLGNIYRHTLGEMMRFKANYDGELFKKYMFKMLKHNPFYWRNVARFAQCLTFMAGNSYKCY